MIKAIIFDCFGVLATSGWLPFKDKYFSNDQQLLDQATWLMEQANGGLISYSEFVAAIAELTNISVEAAFQQIHNNVANAELFHYIEKLKAMHKVGMLSNVAGDWLHEMFSPEQLKLFDAVALSYETGFIKPQEEAYVAVAKQLGVSVEECVLIDDHERYCTGARDVGMHAICYKDIEQLKTDLNKLLTNQ